jgi:archaellum biogenesis protein FlaJ (TadC family)
VRLISKAAISGVRRTEDVIGFISRLFPLQPPATLTALFQRRLEGAMVYVSPAVFARFTLAALIFPAVAEVLVLGTASPGTWPLLVAPLALVQMSPFLVLATRRWQRKRGVESELPYAAMLFYILSHRSYSNLPDAFRKIESLGPGVFPAFFAEAQRILRNLTYGAGGDLTGIERSFSGHPSQRLSEFIHGYSTALVTGRDVKEFVGSESERMLENQVDKWRSYSSLLSSMTEVSFIFLAVFPVGIQMIAGSTPVLNSSQILVVSAVLLSFITGGLLLWMDLNQPLSNNRPYPAGLLVLSAASFLVVMLLYQSRLIDSLVAAASALSVSSACAIASHGHYKTIADGERVVGAMLHDLAELTRAGVELPAALATIATEASNFGTVRDSLAVFSRLLSLGQPPVSAQRALTHPAWIVRISFALLAATLETGGGYEQLDKLSLAFRKVSDSRAAIKSSVLPFAFLGVIVPAISAASAWLLKSMQSLGPGLSFLSIQTGTAGIGGSIVAASFLAGLIVSKAYSQSVRSMVGVPPLLCSALISFFFFGSS